MCGIIGYVGRKEAGPLLLEGLKRFEYRGYDSSGLSLLTRDGKPFSRRAVGPIASLDQKLNGEFPAAPRGCEIDKPRNLAKSVTVE